MQRLRQACHETMVFHSQDGFYLRTSQDGVWIPVNITVTRLHIQPRTLALITARDVRERHEAQARLQQAEGELRRVLASVSDCLWSASIDGAGRWEYRYLSPVIEKLTGRPPDFFLAGPQCWALLVHEEDRPRWRQALGRLRAGQPSQEEYRIVRADGAVRWVRDSVLVSRDAPAPLPLPRSPGGRGKGGARLDGVLTDVTERRLAQEDCAGEERFRLILDSATRPSSAWTPPADHGLEPSGRGRLRLEPCGGDRPARGRYDHSASTPGSTPPRAGAFPDHRRRPPAAPAQSRSRPCIGTAASSRSS